MKQRTKGYNLYIKLQSSSIIHQLSNMDIFLILYSYSTENHVLIFKKCVMFSLSKIAIKSFSFDYFNIHIWVENY